MMEICKFKGTNKINSRKKLLEKLNQIYYVKF